MNYIFQQYTQMGIEPKGTEGYVQEFEINEGKKVTENNYFKVNGEVLELNKEYYPLAFSPNTKVESKSVMLSLKEKNAVWFL
ncbi:MAG: hypothetical protein H3C56_04820, partial [Chitinophagaceae bacterium]|nr:hypothetical protein [Chitinophagaceae bacterium]